jgi:tetratricopeptide (TPR) repeat protein
MMPRGFFNPMKLPTTTYRFRAATSAIGGLIVAFGLTSFVCQAEVSFESLREVWLNSPFPAQVLGNLAFGSGDLEKARFHFNESIAITEYRIANDPDNLVWLSHFSSGYNMLGEISKKEKKYDEALRWYQMNAATLLKFSRKDSSNESIQINLASCYYKIADMDTLTGNPNEASVFYHEGLEIFEVLHASKPTSWVRMGGVGIGNERLGGHALSLKKLEEALKFFTTSVAIREKIVLLLPDVARERKNLAFNRHMLALVLMEKGDLDGALTECGRAILIQNALLAKLPDEESLNKQLQSSYELLGDLAERQHGTRLAIESYTKSAMIGHNLLCAKPDDARIRGDLCRLHGKLARIYIGHNDKISAIKHLKTIRTMFLRLKKCGIALSPHEQKVLRQTEDMLRKN